MSYSVNAQYAQSSNASTVVGTPTGGVNELNADIRNFNYSCVPGSNYCSPMYAVAWDGTNPNIYWNWTDGTTVWDGNINLPSNAEGVDVSILYDNGILNAPYLAVVFSELTTTPSAHHNNVVFRLYDFDPVNHTWSLLDFHNHACNMAVDNFASIDADARGFFAVAWENNGDLVSFAGKLKTNIHGAPHYQFGVDKTINIPVVSGCPDIKWPDIAFYGKSATNTNNYIYYSYQLCGQSRIQQQAQNFNGVYSGLNSPSTIASQYSFTSPTNGVFDKQRIASNEYFALTGSGNGANVHEWSIVAEFTDQDINGNPLSSIMVFTSTNPTGGTSPTCAAYNLNTNYYAGSGVSDFYRTSGVNTYATVENKDGGYINNQPAVAYDKANDHLVIVWNMFYSQTTYSLDFPIGSFPAHVYANPAYDGSTNEPSIQPISTGFTPYSSLDNSAANTASNGSVLVIVSSHNMNEMVYAWLDGTGDIRSKVVISGAQPRISSNDKKSSKSFIHPNPINGNTDVINLYVDNEDIISLNLFDQYGKTMLSISDKKIELESQLTSFFRVNSAGFYAITLQSKSGLNVRSKLLNIK